MGQNRSIIVEQYRTIALTGMLKSFFKKGFLEAGCDEAGRGSLAGPVFAAAVILPQDFCLQGLTDSKILPGKKRILYREIIEKKAIAWGVGVAYENEIDTINIRNASILAMHRAMENLGKTPQVILVDGNFFKDFRKIPHHCFVKGDGRFLSIAAASVLAKTHRDEFMKNLHAKYPHYHWDRNKGYATKDHVQAIMEHGFSPFHRKTFHLKSLQLTLGF